MSRYDLLCCDADETLLDFAQAEENAFFEACSAHALAVDGEAYRRYSAINLACWKLFEQGRLTQPELRVKRYADFLCEIGSAVDPAALSHTYEQALSRQGCALPGAAEALQRWRESVRVIIVTNGIAAVQHGRFAASPFPWMEKDLVISEEVGAAKPDPAMIAIAMARAGITDKRRVLVLGDSLSSDMAAAANAGVDGCWYNPRAKENTSGTAVRYEIRSLDEVDALL
ncbi:MAG: YjjG family noncanonical pyrimidine nucleotidase [Clostridia bacterium]|nr:YjjG family noncanonical pyrimidine nucleotidase [Clostridia bacterium]